MLPVPGHGREAQQRQMAEANTSTVVPGTVVDAASFVADQHPRFVQSSSVPLLSSRGLVLMLGVFLCMRVTLLNIECASARYVPMAGVLQYALPLQSIGIHFLLDLCWRQLML